MNRVTIKFCFKAGLSATETLVLVPKAYGNEALNWSNVFRWYSRFRDGRELVEDDESGLPPYSPDLSPSDYFLFPKLKVKLKGPQFEDVTKIQKAVNDELKGSNKRKFRQLFRNCKTAQNLYICQCTLFWTKRRYMSSSCVFDLKKKISTKTFGTRCVYYIALCFGAFKSPSSGTVHSLQKDYHTQRNKHL
jgi:hypothetical protein